MLPRYPVQMSEMLPSETYAHSPITMEEVITCKSNKEPNKAVGAFASLDP